MKKKNDDQELNENEQPGDLPLETDKNLESITQEMPEVVPDAVAAAKEKDDLNAKQEAQEIRDVSGKLFDSSIHATDDTGAPVLTPTGRFSRIRKPRDKRPQPINIPAGRVDNIDSANQRSSAIVCAGMFIQTGIIFFGDEWQPIKEKGFDEQEYLVTATESYFQATGIVNLPPWLVLVVAYGSYGLRRFQKPRTKSALEKFGEWMGKGFKKMFGWMKRKKPLETDKKTDEEKDKK